MTMAGFQDWVNAMASRSNMSVSVIVGDSEYRACFSDGTELVYYRDSMKMRMKIGRNEENKR